MINKEVLSHIILPLGDYSKNQVRKMEAHFGLGSEERPESQEICFMPEDWVAALEGHYPEVVRKGDIVDSSGRVLGEHNGVHRFTIGQRRGLRVAMGIPFYVSKIDSVSNTVTIGAKEEVMHSKLTATDLNWLTNEPTSAFRAKVKIRYNDGGAAATVYPQADKIIVEFDQAKSAITPGQLAAFYIKEDQNSRVIGGGWIDSASD